MKIFKFVFLILFIIFMYIFTKIYLNMESPLYTCDLSEYNLSFIDYSKLIYSDFKSFISSFASEIYNLNRNPFLNIFFFPFYPFFKESRYGYIIAINIKDAWDSLGEITGETVSENIIQEIFSKFCLGK